MLKNSESTLEAAGKRPQPSQRLQATHDWFQPGEQLSRAPSSSLSRRMSLDSILPAEDQGFSDTSSDVSDLLLPASFAASFFDSISGGLVLETGKSTRERSLPNIPAIPALSSPVDAPCDIGGFLSSGKWFHIPVDEVNVPLALANRSGRVSESNPSLFILDTTALDPSQVRQQEILYELFVTEADYVRDLKLIASLFKEKMIERHVIPEKHIAILFGNVESLLPIHEKFLDNLKKSRLEGLFRNLENCLPDMDILRHEYSLYCVNHPKAVEYLRAEKRNPDLQLFLQFCFLKPETRSLDIGSFLLKPVQRIMKYPLLLDELLKRTPESSPDYCGLKRSAVEIKATVEQINREKDAFDQIKHVSMVTEKLEDSEYLRSTYSPHRRVLCEGNVSKLASKRLMSRPRNILPSSRYAVLFNDVFVLASRSSGRKQISKIIPRENIIGCYDLNHNDGLRFSLRYIDQKIVEVTLLAGSSSEKDKWVAGFRNLLRRRKASGMSYNISFNPTIVSSQDTAVNEDERVLNSVLVEDPEAYHASPNAGSTSLRPRSLEASTEHPSLPANIPIPQSSGILDDFISAYLHYDPAKTQDSATNASASVATSRQASASPSNSAPPSTSTTLIAPSNGAETPSSERSMSPFSIPMRQSHSPAPLSSDSFNSIASSNVTSLSTAGTPSSTVTSTAAAGASSSNVTSSAAAAASSSSGSPPHRQTARQSIGAAAFQARKMLFNAAAVATGSSRRISSTGSQEDQVGVMARGNASPPRSLIRTKKSADLKRLSAGDLASRVVEDGQEAQEVRPWFEGWTGQGIFNTSLLAAAILFWLLHRFLLSLFLVCLLLFHNY